MELLMDFFLYYFNLLTRSFGVGFQKLFRKEIIEAWRLHYFLIIAELRGGTSDNCIVDEQIANTDWEPKWVNKESSKASGK
jgi:hypothetical protein